MTGLLIGGLGLGLRTSSFNWLIGSQTKTPSIRFDRTRHKTDDNTGSKNGHGQGATRLAADNGGHSVATGAAAGGGVIAIDTGSAGDTGDAESAPEVQRQVKELTGTLVVATGFKIAEDSSPIPVDRVSVGDVSGTGITGSGTAITTGDTLLLEAGRAHQSSGTAIITGDTLLLEAGRAHQSIGDPHETTGDGAAVWDDTDIVHGVEIADDSSPDPDHGASVSDGGRNAQGTINDPGSSL